MIIVNNPNCNSVLCLKFLVNKEDWTKLVRYCESCLDIPNCSAVIDWKHDHIRLPARVVTNFIAVRRATV